MTLDSQRRIAMLIDGDNAQASLIEQVLAETATHGIVTTRRIYGDWTAENMSGWKDTMHTYALQPIQQFRYTVRKNATDSALIIDAMDLLHSQNVDGFCIVSSDSDYTRLATRIREQGLFVMGIGRANTPKPFVNACQVFVHTENLSPRTKQKSPPAEAVGLLWTPTLTQAIESSVREDGWASLAAVGGYVRQLDPSFDARTYGYKTLNLLLKSRAELFEMRKPRGGDLQVRLKSGNS